MVKWLDVHGCPAEGMGRSEEESALSDLLSGTIEAVTRRGTSAPAVAW